MDMILSSGFCEMSADEMQMVDGGSGFLALTGAGLIGKGTGCY